MAKTTPLAPSSAVEGKNRLWMIPVISAVARTTMSILAAPYFSSRAGPRSRIRVMFPIRWARPLCPSTWVNRRTYIIGSVIGAAWVENSNIVDSLNTEHRSVARPHSRAKHRVKGAFRVIFSFFFIRIPPRSRGGTVHPPEHITKRSA